MITDRNENKLWRRTSKIRMSLIRQFFIRIASLMIFFIVNGNFRYLGPIVSSCETFNFESTVGDTTTILYLLNSLK